MSSTLMDVAPAAVVPVIAPGTVQQTVATGPLTPTGMRLKLFAGGATGSPDSPEWHHWRSEGIGGSDGPVVGNYAGICCAATWMKGLSELWLIKTGQLKSSFTGNWATQRGRNGEEPARRAFEKATGVILSPVFGEMSKHPCIRSSFDGVTFDYCTLGEIKCPSVGLHEEARKGIAPEYYFTQMLHQGLSLWGDPADGGWVGKTMYYISYIPETADLVWIKYAADEPATMAKASRLMVAEVDFWQHVINKTEPAGEAWKDAAASYIAASLDEALATAAVEMASYRLEQLMGDREKNEGAGVSATHGSRAGSMKYKDATETLMKWYGVEPEFLSGFRGADSKTFTVRIKSTEGKKKVKADGGLSLEDARAEIARIAKGEAAVGQAAFAW